MDQGPGVTCTIVQVTFLMVFGRLVVLAGFLLPCGGVDDLLFIGCMARRAHIDCFCHGPEDRLLIFG